MDGTISRNHHVVPKAYQKRFASNNQVRLVYKDAHRPPEKVKHVKRALVERGFLTVNSKGVLSDDLEDAFARAESQIFDRVRKIVYPSLSPEGAEAVKALAALLFARSYRMSHHGPRMSRQVIDQEANGAEDNQGLLNMFRREFLRDPEPGELIRLIEEHGQTFVSSGVAQVSGILNMYRRAVEKFDPLHVSLYDARGLRHGFVYSDNPVVIARGKGLRDVDNPNRLIAVGDAEMIYFPLDRWTGVCLTGKPEGHARLTQTEVIMVNNATWRGAHRVIAAHPEEDWPSACGVHRERPPR